MPRVLLAYRNTTFRSDAIKDVALKSTLIAVIAICVLSTSSGCWRPFWRKPQPAAPIVFPEGPPPTTPPVIQAINQNTAQVRQLQAEVKVAVKGTPPLSGNLAIERPRRLHLRAGLFGLSSLGIDLGSNDEAFWVWVKQSISPSRPAAVYFARHDEFAGSQMRDMVPIEPEWLIESLGVIHLDPRGPHEGPFPAGKDRLSIHSKIPSREGTMTRITVVHAQYGWVLEQHIYDAKGNRIVSSFASEHKHYPEQGVTLPHHVELRVAPRGVPASTDSKAEEMTLKIDIGNYHINRLMGDPEQLWALPRPDGYPMINLADPRNQAPPREARHQARPNPQVDGMGRPNYRPVYRGLPRRR
jgi:hypothetical protein